MIFFRNFWFLIWRVNKLTNSSNTKKIQGFYYKTGIISHHSHIQNARLKGFWGAAPILHTAEIIETKLVELGKSNFLSEKKNTFKTDESRWGKLNHSTSLI